MSIVRVQQRELEEKQNELSKTLPLLMAMYNAEGAKPQIRYLEGTEGIKTVRAMFEKMKGEFVEIFPVEDVHTTQELMEERKQHHTSLREQQTRHRVLAVMENPDPAKVTSMGKGEWRMVPSSKFPMHGSIVVRENHVFLFSYRSAILSVVIVSKEIADAALSLETSAT